VSLKRRSCFARKWEQQILFRNDGKKSKGEGKNYGWGKIYGWGKNDG
jgi:hypothetical protein